MLFFLIAGAVTVSFIVTLFYDKVIMGNPVKEDCRGGMM